MILNTSNNRYFQDFVVSDMPREEVERELKKLQVHDRNTKLLKAIIECRNKVRSTAEKFSEIGEATFYLIKMVNYISENVKVVQFVVEDDAAAYTIFETLNDRGLALATIDLVKNHIFGRISSSKSSNSEIRMREAETRWAQMMHTLANHKADNFLKAFWTSQYGRTQKDALFRTLKKLYGTRDKALTLSSEMLEVAEQYAALENQDDPIWSNYDKKSKESLRAINLLSGGQTYPIILSALKKLEKREIERLLWLLECIIVRYQFIGGERTGRLEIACASAAKGIFNGEHKSASAIRHALREVYPSDDEFRQSFSVKEESNNARVHYVLSNLEIEARRQASIEDYRSLDPGIGLTVEHILPRNPGREWNTITDNDKTIVEECACRLGNLCLLGKSNRTLGNLDFETKKQAFRRSELRLTQSVADINGDWSRRAISHRQAHLAKLALSVWSFQ